MRVLKFLTWSLGWAITFLCVLWAVGALHFDFPVASLRQRAALAFILILLAAVIFVRRQGRKLLAVLVIFSLVLIWWLTLRPNDNKPWQPDVGQTAWAEIDGDVVTLHNVRNFDYRTEADYTPNWEERKFRLSQITGLDLFINYWGPTLMAHPIVSFRFADTLPISFSIEARKVVGQIFSPIASLYRQAQLIYVASDERDSVRVRANYRHEDVYLYRTVVPPDRARERFLEYLRSINRLHAHPRWYNVLTTNCTTAIRDQHPEAERLPWDWRILVNGKGDEMMYERHLIATDDLPFAELKKRSRIDEKARAANDDPDFSRRIREGLPGFKPN